MIKKLVKYRIFVFLGLVIVITLSLSITKNFTFKKKASEISPSDRWTVDQIIGKELTGDNLQKLKTTESELRNDIKLVNQIEEIKNNGQEITLDKVLSGQYKQSFGVPLESVVPELINSTDENTLDVKVKGVSSSGLGSPTIGKRDLPTIDGYNVDTFTGAVNISYPISVPPVRGNLPIGLSLNYSSRTVDDLRLNNAGIKEASGTLGHKKKIWEEYILSDSSSPVGLGWNMSTFGAITVDADHDDEFMLQLSGKAIRIKWDKTTNTYKTYPDNKIKLERVGDLGAWKVTDASGTVYLFGSVEGERHADDSVEPARTGVGYQHLNLSPMSANEYTVKTFRGNEGTLHCSNDHILKWNLSKISDIYGNTAEIDYEQEILTMLGYVNSYSSCKYTSSVRIKTIKYNWDQDTNRYLSTVNFNYTDLNGVGNPYYDIYQTRGRFYGEYEALYSPIMSNNKILSSIETKNNNTLLSRYDFSYTKSYKNSKIKFGCPDIPEDLQEQYQDGKYKDYCNREENGSGEKARQLLLTKITVKGYNGQGEKRPQSFCYKSLKDTNSPEVCDGVNTNIDSTVTTPNDLYLVKADNGYAGIVNYEYEKVEKIDKICFNWRRMNFDGLDKNWRKICTDDNGYVDPTMKKNNYTGYYRVKKTIADNGMNKKKATEYTYIGQSQGYGANYSKADVLGYSSVTGLQFLGYPTVRIKAYDLETGKVLSYVEQKTSLSLETDNCFMVEPRKGMVYESNVLNESGAIIGFTKTDIKVKPNLQCVLPDLNDGANWNLTDASKGWIVFEPYIKSTTSEIDGKKSKKETIYDFEVYPNDLTRNFGNVVKTIDYGNPDILGDEVYLYTRYIQDQAKESSANYPNINEYLKKNLIGLIGETYVSTEDKNKPEEVSANKRFNLQETKYDERLTEWGYQTGISGVKGLPSTTKTIMYGTSIEKPEERVDISTLIDYDKYGLPVKQTAPNGTPSTTYYDNTYHMIPVCQVQWKVNATDPLVYQSKDQACDYGQNRDKKMVNRFLFDSQKSLDRGLFDRIQDPNQAIAKYEYDEYGRVTKTYQANKDTGQPEEKSLAEAGYFDNQFPMRTRVKTRIDTGSVNTYETIDTFFDGFGNQTQTISYDQTDKDGKYASLNTQYFNGIGQVEKKIEGIPIRDLTPPPIPQPILQATIDSQKHLATITDTTYDFFSRPLSTTITVGGPYGNQIVSTSRIVYDGYKVHTYNNAGNQSTVEVQGLKTISTNYLCSQDRNCTSINGQPITILSTNNILGKTTITKDTRGIAVKELTYNSIGVPLLEKDLDRGMTKYYYDNLGRLSSVKDSNGNISKSTQFDALNRVTKSQLFQSGKTVPDSIIETVYDTQYIGKASEISMQKGGSLLQKQIIKYDLLGKPKETKDVFYTSKYMSELGVREGNIVTEKTSTATKTGLPLTSKYVVNGTVVDKINYQYDEVGKFKSATDDMAGNIPLVQNLSYDYRGSLLSLSYDNNIQAVNEYDNSGRTKKKTINKTIPDSGSPMTLFSQTSTFDERTKLLVNIETKSQNAPNVSSKIQYDSLARLSSVTGNEYTGMYRFDNVNNLTRKYEIDTPGYTNKSFSDNIFFTDRFTSSSSNPCLEDEEYKAITKYDVNVNGCPYHGVMKSVINNISTRDELRTYLYDKKGNLVKEFTTNGLVREYEYDGTDLPVTITDYDNNHNVKVKEKYIYGIGGTRLAKVDTFSKDYNLYLGSYEKKKDKSGISETVSMDVPLASIVKIKKENGSWVKNYTYANYQGSTAFILDGQGNYLPEFQNGANYFRYFAYGAEINKVNLASLPRENTYTGQKKDTSTNLMYYNARYYNPETGLFIQADSADDGLNRYAYVGGNPIMMTDPSGNVGGQPPYYMDQKFGNDPDKAWSLLKIDPVNSKYKNTYTNLVNKTRSEFQKIMKENGENYPEGQAAVMAVFKAMKSEDMSVYIPHDNPRPASIINSEIKAINKEIANIEIKLQNANTNSERFVYDSDLLINKLKKEDLEIEKSQFLTEPRDLIEYMKTTSSECREQAFLGQYLMKEALNIDTEYTYWKGGQGGSHFFLLWKNPDDNLMYQLDVLYAIWNDNSTAQYAYYFPYDKVYDLSIPGTIVATLNNGIR